MHRSHLRYAAFVVVAHCVILLVTADKFERDPVKRRAARASSQFQERVEFDSILEERKGFGLGLWSFEDELEAASVALVGKPPLRPLDGTLAVTGLQCMAQAHRFLVPVDEDPYFFFGQPSRDGGGAGTDKPPPEAKRPCGMRWIPQNETFSGVDKIILIGDSTVIRTFWHLVGAKDSVYKTRVAEIANNTIYTLLRTHTGRAIPLIFHRLLYLSTAEAVLSRAFADATKNSLMIMSCGPHDTAWLIYDKVIFGSLNAMPGFGFLRDIAKKTPRLAVNTYNFFTAQKYWTTYTTKLANMLNHHLASFGPQPGDRPVFLFREQFLPRCSDLKYSTRRASMCPNLLRPIVVPHYRRELQSRLAVLNIPVISMDSISGRPKLRCYLADAGHLPRYCKPVEIQLYAQAFRLARRHNILQGGVSATMNDTATQLFTEVLTTNRLSMSKLYAIVTKLSPRGTTTLNEKYRSLSTRYAFAPLAPPSQGNADLIRRFDDPKYIEQWFHRWDDLKPFVINTNTTAEGDNANNRHSSEDDLANGGSDNTALFVEATSKAEGGDNETASRLGDHLIEPMMLVEMSLFGAVAIFMWREARRR